MQVRPVFLVLENLGQLLSRALITRAQFLILLEWESTVHKRFFAKNINLCLVGMILLWLLFEVKQLMVTGGLGVRRVNQ